MSPEHAANRQALTIPASAVNASASQPEQLLDDLEAVVNAAEAELHRLNANS